MDADAFRHFYNYHFAENRKIWDWFIARLTYAQFTQAVDYSIGSLREQVVHMLSVDEAWFSELAGVEPSQPLPPTDGDDRAIIRAEWDRVESFMRAYLADLQDDALFSTPIREPEEDQALTVWQVLLHVANHGTDHRAQILRVLHDLGMDTPPQDYIFYVYDNP